MNPLRIPITDALGDVLGDMNAEELRVTYEAAQTVSLALLGALNQPRCTGRAEDVVTELWDFTVRLANAAGEAARTVTPTTPKHRWDRDATVLLHAVEHAHNDTDEDVLASQVAALAATLAAPAGRVTS